MKGGLIAVLLHLIAIGLVYSLYAKSAFCLLSIVQMYSFASANEAV